jgi:very-short-patch-repair endonuclease
MDLSSLGADSHGVWRRAAALGLLRPGQVRGLLLDGDWQSPLPGIYADGGYDLGASQWACAGVLASLPAGATWPSTRAVVCGRDAARLWLLPLIDDRDPATGALDFSQHDVAVRAYLRELRSHPRTPDDPVHVLHRRQLKLEPDSIVLRDGVWVTTVERTLVDLAGLLSLEALICALDAAVQRGLTTIEAMQGRVDVRKGLRYGPLLVEAVAKADAGAESPAETLARLLLVPWLPGLRTQVPVMNARGRVIARLDLADAELKLAVESDGKRGHSGDAMVAKDRQRDAATAALGWWTERFTWFQLRTRQEQVVATVRQRATKRQSAA